MTVLRPLCVVCHHRPREDGSARCHDCGPGRINAPAARPRPALLRPLDHAAELLGDTDTRTNIEEF